MLESRKLVKINILIMTTLFLTISFAFSQDIPQKISYQGKLMEDDVPVNGTKKFIFSFVGTEWSEEQSIEVVNGIYSVKLGSINPIPIDLFASSLNVALQISVEGTTLSPTTEILPVPYAFYAQRAGKADDSDKLGGLPSSHYEQESETDPTVLNSVKDGVSWNEISDIPSGISDGDDVGIDSETDPTFSVSPAKNITDTDIVQWNVAYGDRLKWDGKSVGIDPTVGRASLGLGSASTRNATDIVGNNINLPSGSAIVSYVSGVVPDTTQFATKNELGDIEGNLILRYNSQEYGKLYYNSNNDLIFRAGGGHSKIRTQGDLYLQYSDSSSWNNLYAGMVKINDYIQMNDVRIQTLSDVILKLRSDEIRFDVDTERGYNIILSKANGYPIIRPSESQRGYLGNNSYPWAQVHTSVIYRELEQSLSDRRFKENINPINGALSKIKKLKGVKFDFTKDVFGEDDEFRENNFGFIAQDVQEVLPELIKGNEETGRLTLNYDGIIPFLVEAIKEQQVQIEELKRRLEILDK